MRRAFDLGITHFDLANNYGPPYGSRGDQLRPDPARGLRPAAATSWSSPPRPAGTCGPGPTATAARASTCWPAWTSRCSGMGLDYVDIFYSHRSDPETPLEETMGALATAVRQGKALYVGHLVVLRVARPARPRRSWRELGTPLLIHQPSYSMLNRWIEDGAAGRPGEVGVGLHRASARWPRACSPTATSTGSRPARGRPGQSLAEPGLADRRRRSATCAALNEIAAGRGQSARPDGGGLDPARSADHLDPGRRQQRGATRRQRRRGAPTSTSPARNSQAIDTYAVEAGINIWEQPSLLP